MLAEKTSSPELQAKTNGVFMNRQQLYIFCLSVFGAFLLLNANYQASSAKNQSDDIASRLDGIETSSDIDETNQKVTELEYRIDSIEGDVEEAKSDISQIQFEAISNLRRIQSEQYFNRSY